jgi:hypothetical protein
VAGAFILMSRLIKQKITEAVIKQLPYENTPLDKIIRSWWFTMSGDGLRLTPLGDKRFQDAGIEYYICPLQVKHYTWYKFITDCNTKLKCPYYLGVNKKESERGEPFIRLYDSKIAMMMTLYGDIYSYLESIKAR